MTADVLEAQIREQKVTTNDYIAGNGSVLKVYLFTCGLIDLQIQFMLIPFLLFSFDVSYYNS